MRLIMILLMLLLVVVGAASAQENSPRLRALDFTPFEEALSTFSAERAAEIDVMVFNATVVDVQAAMTAGELTSEELTLYFLDRIHRYDETLRSYLELNPNALEEARAADALRAAGTVLGPLHGIPVNLKDNIETAAPMHTTGGAEILLDHVPAQDAPLVRQLRAAGAVILGKASLSELAGAVTSVQPGANAISGAGVNAYGAAFPVAGSSSGSGISSSAYLTLLSVGTETSGSLLAPAAFGGNVGMKPSRGLVSGEGIIPLISYQDSAGPIARSVTDAAVLLSVIDEADIDYAAGLSPTALNGVTVGILRDNILAQAPQLEDTSDNPAMLSRIADGLSAAHAVTVDIPTLAQPQITAALVLGLAFDTVNYLADAGAPIESLADLQAYNAAMPERRIPFGQDFVDIAVQVAQSLLTSAQAAPDEMGELYEALALGNRTEAEATLAAVFADSGVDVLVSLTNIHSMLYATAGYPAITVPLGLRQNGMPAGVTFIGRQGEDAALLAYAYAFEQATSLRVNPPLDSSTPAAEFADAEWQWQEFQSMDGSATTVPHPENYTLLFQADGTVRIQADCNRGSGSYSVEQAILSISPGPLTRAACPPDSLSDRYLELLGFVASYAIEDGELYLSLMADGGLLRFSRAS